MRGGSHRSGHFFGRDLGPVPAHPPQNTPSAPPSPRHRLRLGKATCKHTKPPSQTPPRAPKQARPSPSMSPGRGAAARTAKPTSSHLPATLRTQPGAGRARAPLHRIHHLRGGGQRRRSVAAWRPRRSLHIFRALCRPGEGPAPSGAQRRLPPGGTLIGPLAALPNCKAPPYPRERRPGRVAHRRSGSRRARHARGQRDAGVPHAGGKPWAGPSGIRLAIPIGVPRGGGWLLNDRQSHKSARSSTPACLTDSCRLTVTHAACPELISDPLSPSAWPCAGC